MSDPDACAAAIAACNADAVINAAAYTAVDRAEDEQAEAMRINGTAPGAMASAAASCDLPVVHISTDYVFDGSGEEPFKVTDATKPLRVYGRTKLAGEDAVRSSPGETSWRALRLASCRAQTERGRKPKSIKIFWSGGRSFDRRSVSKGYLSAT